MIAPRRSAVTFFRSSFGLRFQVSIGDRRGSLIRRCTEIHNLTVATEQHGSNIGSKEDMFTVATADWQEVNPEDNKRDGQDCSGDEETFHGSRPLFKGTGAETN